MSSYLVNEETLNVIMELVREVGIRFPYPLTTDEDNEKMFKKLINLNIRALEERYGKDDFTKESKERATNYRYKVSYPSNRFQQLKSLQCYLYQCSEGKVPKTKLYKELDRVCNQLAFNIVFDMPEYEKARWG